MVWATVSDWPVTIINPISQIYSQDAQPKPQWEEYQIGNTLLFSLTLFSVHNWQQWNFSIWSLCLLTLTKVNIDGEIQFLNVAILVLGQWILHNSKIFDHQLHHCRYLLLNKSSLRMGPETICWYGGNRNCILQKYKCVCYHWYDSALIYFLIIFPCLEC